MLLMISFMLLQLLWAFGLNLGDYNWCRVGPVIGSWVECTLACGLQYRHVVHSQISAPNMKGLTLIRARTPLIPRKGKVFLETQEILFLSLVAGRST